MCKIRKKDFSFMIRSLIIFIACLCILGTVSAKEVTLEQVIEAIYKVFNSGDYPKALSYLDNLDRKASQFADQQQEVKGLVAYWKGLTKVKMNEFPDAIKHFKEAIALDYDAKDLHYELAQAYYISEELKAARSEFRKSVKINYKSAVSLYYMAFISQQLGDIKKAVAYYNAIEKLPTSEKKEVLQAARMQVGDIYLKRVERLPDSFKAVEEYVIPQYESALDWDPDSTMAPEIKAKIEALQRKYNLVLFKMRNGRNTTRPPYFIKANLAYNYDNNVNTLDEESLSDSDVDVASSYYTVGTFGRYTFYPNDTFSISPELIFSHTKYLSDEESIFLNDNQSLTLNLKTTFEHFFKKKPATFYFDIGQTISRDDADADGTLQNNTTTNSLTLSEEFQYFENSPSIFRLKTASTTDQEDETLNYNTNSFIYEQLVTIGSYSFYLYSSYDMSRYPDYESLDTNANTIRLDWIPPALSTLFNSSIYVSRTGTDYIENEDKGTTSLISWGFNLNRPLSSNLFIYFDFTSSSQSAPLDTDNYSKQTYAFTLDYFY